MMDDTVRNSLETDFKKNIAMDGDTMIDGRTG